MKKGKRETREGLICRVRKTSEHYNYERILEADTLKQKEMKEKIRTEYLRLLDHIPWSFPRRTK